MDLRAALDVLQGRIESLSAQRDRLEGLVEAVEQGESLSPLPPTVADFYDVLIARATNELTRRAVVREREFLELAYLRGEVPPEAELLFAAVDEQSTAASLETFGSSLVGRADRRAGRGDRSSGRRTDEAGLRSATHGCRPHHRHRRAAPALRALLGHWGRPGAPDGRGSAAAPAGRASRRRRRDERLLVGRGHRRPRTGQGLRRLSGSGRSRPLGAAWRGPRLPGAQRSRQVDGRADPAWSLPPHRRFGVGVRAGPRGAARRGDPSGLLRSR